MKDAAPKSKPMNYRPNWLAVSGISAAGAALLAGFGLLQQHRWGGGELHGPVAVVKGMPPTHGFLGMEFDENASVPLTIQSVLDGSGAAESGLQPGDVILAVAEIERPDRKELLQRIKASKPGDLLKLKISRGAGQIGASVRLISFEDMVLLRERARMAGAE